MVPPFSLRFTSGVHSGLSGTSARGGSWPISNTLPSIEGRGPGFAGAGEPIIRAVRSREARFFASSSGVALATRAKAPSSVSAMSGVAVRTYFIEDFLAYGRNGHPITFASHFDPFPAELYALPPIFRLTGACKNNVIISYAWTESASHRRRVRRGRHASRSRFRLRGFLQDFAGDSERFL